MYLQGSDLIENLRLLEVDQVVDDEIRCPEVLDELRADRVLSVVPVRRRVENHPGLGPKKFVRQPKTYLLRRRKRKMRSQQTKSSSRHTIQRPFLA